MVSQRNILWFCAVGIVLRFGAAALFLPSETRWLTALDDSIGWTMPCFGLWLLGKWNEWERGK